MSVSINEFIFLVKYKNNFIIAILVGSKIDIIFIYIHI